MPSETLFEYIVLASSFVALHYGVKKVSETYVNKVCSPDQCDWMYLFLTALMYTAVIKSLPGLSSKVISVT